MNGHNNHMCELEVMGRKAHTQGIPYKSFYSRYGSILDRLQSDGSNIPQCFLPLSAQVETWKYFWPNEAFLASIPTGNPREPPIDHEAQNQSYQTTTLPEEPPSSPGLTLADDTPMYLDDIVEAPRPRKARSSSATATCSARRFASDFTSSSVSRAHPLPIEQNASQEEVVPLGPLKSLPTEQSGQKPIVSLPSTFQPPVAPLHAPTPSDNELVTAKTTSQFDGLDDGANHDIKDEPHAVADAKKSPFPYKPRANNGDHIDIPGRQEREDRCANCDAEDHLLHFCMGPVDKFGFISGCPRCNTTTHLFEHCPRQKKNIWTSYLRYLVSLRHNRPPIRWAQDFREIPDFWNQSRRPWTYEFSIKQASKLGTSYGNSGRPENNSVYDPAWDNPDTIPSQAYPGQTVQDMSQGEESKLKKLVEEDLEHPRTVDHLRRLERFRKRLDQNSTLLGQKFDELLNLSSQISPEMLEERRDILTLARRLDYIADLEMKEARGEALLLEEAKTIKTKKARQMDLEERLDRYLQELHASYDDEMELKERIRRLLNQVLRLAHFETMQQNGVSLRDAILEEIATLSEKEEILKIWFGVYRRRFSLSPEPFVILDNERTTSCTDFRDFAYSSFHALHYMPPQGSPPSETPFIEAPLPESPKYLEAISNRTMEPKDTANQNSNILNRHSDNQDMYRTYEQNYRRNRSSYNWKGLLPLAKDLSSVPVNTAASSSDPSKPTEEKLAGSVQYKVALSKEQKTLEKEILELQREIKEIEGFEKRTETLTTKQLQQVGKKGEKKAELERLRERQNSNRPKSHITRMIHKIQKSHNSRFAQAKQKRKPGSSPGSEVGQPSTAAQLKSSVTPSSSIDSLPPLPSQVNNVQTKAVESKRRVPADSYAGKAAHVPPKLEPLREYRRNKKVSSKQEEWPSTSSQDKKASTGITKGSSTMSYAEKAGQMLPRSKNPPEQQRREINIVPEVQNEFPSTSSEAKELNSDVVKEAPVMSYAEKAGQMPPKPKAPPEQQHRGTLIIPKVQEEWPAMSSEAKELNSNFTKQVLTMSYAEKVGEKTPDLEAPTEQRHETRKVPSAQEQWPVMSSQDELSSSDVINRAPEISYAKKVVQEPISPKLESSKESTVVESQDPFPPLTETEEAQPEASTKLEHPKEPTVVKTPAPFPILSAMEAQSASSTKLEVSKKPTVVKSQDPFPIVIAMEEAQPVASDESESSTSYAHIASGLRKASQDAKASFKVLKSKLPPPVYEIQDEDSSLNDIQSSPVVKNESTSTSNPASKASGSGEVFHETGALSSVEQQSTSSAYVPPQKRRIPSSSDIKPSPSLQTGNTNAYVPPAKRKLSSTSDVESRLSSNPNSLNKRRISSGSMGTFSYEARTQNPLIAGSPKSRLNQLNSRSPKLSVVLEGIQESSSSSSVPPKSQDIKPKQASPLHSPVLNNQQLLFPPTEYPEGSTRRCSSTPPNPYAEDVDLRDNISRSTSPRSTNLQQKETRTLRRREKRRALSSGASVPVQIQSLLVPPIAVPQIGIAHNSTGSSKASSRTLSIANSSVEVLSDTGFSFELPQPDDFDISFHHPHPDDFRLSDDENDTMKSPALNPPDSFELDSFSESSSNQDDAKANANATISNPNPAIQEVHSSWADECENIICWQCNEVGHVTYECPESVFNPLIQGTNHSAAISDNNPNHGMEGECVSTPRQDTSTFPTPAIDNEMEQRSISEEEDKNMLERKHPSPTHPPGAMRDDGSIVPFYTGDWKCGSNRCDYWNFATNTCCLWCGASPDNAAVILGSDGVSSNENAGPDAV
ncbi:hypothetical protein EAF04_000647 [Stromatinia cepivora]|nr:hypothetical protein EAF04_000647 [Stromatinia cepivora]